MKRKRYTNNFKARVALDAIKGQKTVNELASEYGVHVTQINSWRKHLLDAVPVVFNGKQKQQEEAHEEEKDVLYQQIGRLKVELDWLKKKTGLLV